MADDAELPDDFEGCPAPASMARMRKDFGIMAATLRTYADRVQHLECSLIANPLGLDGDKIPDFDARNKITAVLKEAVIAANLVEAKAAARKVKYDNMSGLARQIITAVVASAVSGGMAIWATSHSAAVAVVDTLKGGK